MQKQCYSVDQEKHTKLKAVSLLLINPSHQSGTPSGQSRPIHHSQQLYATPTPMPIINSLPLRHIHLYGVINDEVCRTHGVNLVGISPHLLHSVTHSCKIHDGGNASEKSKTPMLQTAVIWDIGFRCLM